MNTQKTKPKKQESFDKNQLIDGVINQLEQDAFLDGIYLKFLEMKALGITSEQQSKVSDAMIAEKKAKIKVNQDYVEFLRQQKN